MRSKSTIVALAALLVCSACADKTPMKRAENGATQSYASIRWDEATAATYAAKVENSRLIMMR